MSTELEKIAAAKAREAVYYDKLGQKAKAVKKYQEALDILRKLNTLTHDPIMKGVFTEKINEYQRRIEELMNIPTPTLLHSKTTESTAPVEEFSMPKPSIRWDDIINIENAKKAIRESIVYPTKRPDLFPLGWPRGILLFGPPGCGKTLLAAAVANEIDAKFFAVDAASIMSKWLGESERNIARLFNKARQVSDKQKKPAIIFIDEVDVFLSERFLEVGGEARVRTQLLKEMDGIHEKGTKRQLYVIAVTNKPWNLDEPFIRRFQKRIFVPLPDLEARRKLFEKYLNELKINKDIEIHQLAVMTDGYSAADIRDVCIEVQMKVVNELFEAGRINDEPRKATIDDFLEVLKKRKPAIALDKMQKILEWNEKYGTS